MEAVDGNHCWRNVWKLGPMTLVRDAATELGEVIMRKDAEIAALRGLVAALEAERLEAIDDKAAEPSAGVVAERVDAVIGDVLAGRTTPKQNRVLREVSERAERVSPKSDAAVGKAVGG